jgi:DNA-binding response OmpR family regulator
MPEMDGFAVLSHIRKTDGISKTPVIVVTGRKSEEDREFMMQLGANAYLTKPFSPSQLLETVNKILQPKK